ncbi:MAG: class I SAM-dependent methyltransferase [Cytophaga sp.]|nr:class I SAM-dependent methyltransferase [Undibacterium sp.]
MKNECPACTDKKFEIVKKIDVEVQHALYIKNNIAVSNELTKNLSEIASKYEVRKCLNCKLEYANPFIAPNAAWYSILYSNLKLFPTSRWEFNFVKHYINSNDLVVDYGCGDGKFLISIADKTKNVCGFDFSLDAVVQARREGIVAEVLDDEVTASMKITPSRAAHITAFHVLEHMDDPTTLFRFAMLIAAPTTCLWVAVPSDKRASRLYGGADILDEPPHHLTRWNRKSLEEIAIKANWKLIDFRYEPLNMRTKLWEITRRTGIYRKLQVKNKMLDRLIRIILSLPVYILKQSELRELTGFSMLACYQYQLTLSK